MTINFSIRRLRTKALNPLPEYWELGSGTLRIYGEGEMWDYDNNSNIAPWRNFEFTSLVIEDGITLVGEFAFMSYRNLDSVKFGENVQTIGAYAFAYCTSLRFIIIPNCITEFGYDAFGGCVGLTIYCNKGYKAEVFAKENGFEFKYLDSQQKAILGDIDGDGIVTVADLVSLNKYLVGLISAEDMSENWRERIDMDGDGIVNELDSLCLISYLLK